MYVKKYLNDLKSIHILFFSGFYQPAGPLIRSASPGGSTASSASAPSAAGAVGGAPVGVAAPLGVVAPPTATVQPTVVTSVAASSNNNSRTTSSSTSANNIRDSGEFSPSQKEQPGTISRFRIFLDF